LLIKIAPHPCGLHKFIYTAMNNKHIDFTHIKYSTYIHYSATYFNLTNITNHLYTSPISYYAIYQYINWPTCLLSYIGARTMKYRTNKLSTSLTYTTMYVSSYIPSYVLIYTLSYVLSYVASYVYLSLQPYVCLQIKVQSYVHSTYTQKSFFFSYVPPYIALYVYLGLQHYARLECKFQSYVQPTYTYQSYVFSYVPSYVYARTQAYEHSKIKLKYNQTLHKNVRPSSMLNHVLKIPILPNQLNPCTTS
jgi:hypothetical protein